MKSGCVKVASAFSDGPFVGPPVGAPIDCGLMRKTQPGSTRTLSVRRPPRKWYFVYCPARWKSKRVDSKLTPPPRRSSRNLPSCTVMMMSARSGSDGSCSYSTFTEPKTPRL